MKVRVNQKLVFVPNMLDQIDGRTNLKKGDLVKVINVRGCPPANTMGHCYVGHPETGEFIAYVPGDYHIGYGATASDARDALLWSMENE